MWAPGKSNKCDNHYGVFVTNTRSRDDNIWEWLFVEDAVGDVDVDEENSEDDSRVDKLSTR